MAYRSLREFLETLERAGELQPSRLKDADPESSAVV